MTSISVKRGQCEATPSRRIALETSIDVKRAEIGNPRDAKNQALSWVTCDPVVREWARRYPKRRWSRRVRFSPSC